MLGFYSKNPNNLGNIYPKALGKITSKFWVSERKTQTIWVTDTQKCWVCHKPKHFGCNAKIPNMFRYVLPKGFGF